MRYLMTFSYDGSKYQGYQKQPNVRTIQEEIEKALFKIAGNRTISIHASGRTDSGVHALNQKAHFDLENKIEIERLKHSINSLIPKDIFVKKIEEVCSDFHARFDVIHKEYIYKVNMGEYNPIEKDYVYQCCEKLDVAEMDRALKYLEGTHDFKSFTKNDLKENYVRTILRTNLLINKKNHNMITFVFVGTGFMRYQVRNMVGTLIEIGKGKKKSVDIIDILNAKDRSKAGVIAPSSGLYLKNVNYNE
ncbi:MAG: tRNA pseudouridine(38-40) synthase TruA [Bacilli bacterium]|nr:tRNA pseudouridine(38-40) synthase TruA [Bacilli bacterium]